jgi:hypothetical protein
MKFKEGDILEFIGVDTYSAQKGARAIYKGDNGLIQVEWIRDELSGSQMDGGYYSGWFIKVGELETQKEDRILKENKKVMKFNLEEGKQRVIKMLEEHIVDFKTDMLQDIKGVINEDREDTIEQIDDIIGSIKNNTLFVNIAIEGVREAITVTEVLDAMENTCFEETEERTILVLFGLGESVVI